MARTGRQASRTGDMVNIIADLERGDELAIVAEGSQTFFATVAKVYKSQISSWGIARLVPMATEDRGRRFMFQATIKAPEHFGFDAQFVGILHDHGIDEVTTMEVTG